MEYTSTRKGGIYRQVYYIVISSKSLNKLEKTGHSDIVRELGVGFRPAFTRTVQFKIIDKNKFESIIHKLTELGIPYKVLAGNEYVNQGIVELMEEIKEYTPGD